LKTVTLGLISIFFVACGKGGSPNELRRVPSPNGNYDAVLANFPSGAIGSYELGILLEPRGTRIPTDSGEAEAYASVLGEKIDRDAITWIDDHTLLLKYPAGSEVWKFQSLWMYVTNPERREFTTIEVVLERQPLRAPATGQEWQVVPAEFRRRGGGKE
jgi:hypothetical protein